MGTFDTYADSPNLIKAEGETITLTFKPGVPATGQGTVSWNIPVPGVDCNSSADGRAGAYSGIVVLLSTSPLNASNIPANGMVYVGDPTANPDMHAGDKIGGALVVGAFYEREQKARGEDLTSDFVVSDLKSNTAYYVAAYAVDDQLRYHKDGVRAYSDNLTGETYSGQPSTQVIKIGSEGILPTDGTGLDPNVTYQFDILYDDTYPERKCEKVYHIEIDGMEAGTYADLVEQLNKQFALIENPPQSPVAPNTGKLYWNATQKKLYEFDGNALVEKTVLKEPTDPAQVTDGEYWYNPTTGSLYIASAGPTWTPVNVIDYGPVDPRAFKTTDHWFDIDDNQAYLWGGSTWCTVPTVVGEPDPSVATVIGGTYWYDTVNSVLYVWNAVTCDWDVTGAVMWPQAPNMLLDGTYWFDLATDTLFARETSPASWIEQTPIISSTQPTAPALNALWYNPTAETLAQWNGVSWTSIPVLVWEGDPTDVASCALWWRSTDDELFVWDVLNAAWVPVVEFIQSATDPRLPPEVATGTIWYKPSAGTILRWDGGAWVEVDIVVHPADPTQFATGDAWRDEASDQWFIWDLLSPGTWVEVNPIDSAVDPTLLATGTFWFDTDDNILYTRSGIAWIVTPYVTSPPLPAVGEKWFNLNDNKLYAWNGDRWVEAAPIIFATIDNQACNNSTGKGHLKFSTREIGSGMNLMVLTPGTPGELGTGFASFGYQEIGSSTYRVNEPNFYVSQVPEDVFLFLHLTPEATLSQHVYGTDGLSPIPSYDEIGVGTDGTPDERRELADSLRRQLGHPVTTVELTKEQMDTAIRLALETFRLRSSAAYKRGFFFLQIQPGKQEYILTNRQAGYHKIVNVTSCHRFTSAFLSTAHGAGVYGQIVLQHLYNMGTYDLTSYHLISQYVEQLEHLFATRLTFHWDESQRRLSLYNSFVYGEKILMDCTVERTEQELFKDRLTKNWIRRWALAESMVMLAQIRGKFGSLPGAGGGVTLNASELQAQADALKEQLIAEVDDYISADPEDYGLHTTFIIG